MIKDCVLIDLGSSTVKVYTYFGKLVCVLNKTIFFKEEFSPKKGISKKNYILLCDIFDLVKKNYPNKEVLCFATAIFRKMSRKVKSDFLNSVEKDNGINLKIINHDIENQLLDAIFIGKIPSKDVLVINIGGGSTELVVVKGESFIERKNLDIGVGTIISKFPGIIDEDNFNSKKEIKDFVIAKLEKFDALPKVAIYTGGELDYMQKTNYPLKDNYLFKDDLHPSLILLADFDIKNNEIFSEKMSVLKQFMPKNPDWMVGSRACSALAEAICEFYGIDLIVPSNLNLIDGIVANMISKRIEL